MRKFLLGLVVLLGMSRLVLADVQVLPARMVNVGTNQFTYILLPTQSVQKVLQWVDNNWPTNVDRTRSIVYQDALIGVTNTLMLAVRAEDTNLWVSLGAIVTNTQGSISNLQTQFLTFSNTVVSNTAVTLTNMQNVINSWTNQTQIGTNEGPVWIMIVEKDGFNYPAARQYLPGGTGISAYVSVTNYNLGLSVIPASASNANPAIAASFDLQAGTFVPPVAGLYSYELAASAYPATNTHALFMSLVQNILGTNVLLNGNIFNLCGDTQFNTQTMNTRPAYCYVPAGLVGVVTNRVKGVSDPGASPGIAAVLWTIKYYGRRP